MTWIKLDDRAIDHPKIAKLSYRAFWWWIKGLSYASAYLTDGVLPSTFFRHVPKTVRAELTGAGLWVFNDPNLSIHDYLGHQSSREKVEGKRKYAREYKKVTANLPAGSEKPTTPENREQRTDTENREQERPPSSAKPLISGEASSVGWWKIHGSHAEGFCDWVCLPQFLFDEFCRKSGQGGIQGRDGGVNYVRGWAAKVREQWSGPVGDNLKFWRDRWAESHRVEQKPKHRSTAEVLAEYEAKKAGRAS